MLFVALAGAAVYSSELLLNGIVTQKLEYERFVFVLLSLMNLNFSVGNNVFIGQVLSSGVRGVLEHFCRANFVCRNFCSQDFIFKCASTQLHPLDHGFHN
jgi:hypothetical protein